MTSSPRRVVPSQEGPWTCRLQEDASHLVGIRLFLKFVLAKRYTWVSSLVKDPKDPSSSGRAVLTMVTVPERPARAREAVVIPGPAVSGPVVVQEAAHGHLATKDKGW
ncbi:hypothetical protein NHX12_010678 [Muraenolepis orangiensis]|uniref:Uncharacterized protein n=1 Tax=Muraenolepis orangiensis TaxID=630683 RepID=A0A9Q0DKA3_9TELE|nr:hypothetical protein NHX12_010678 [Muraenolepis orangiensis]